MTAITEIASPLRLQLVVKVVAVAIMLSLALAGVLTAHDDSLDARVAQTTVVEAQAALERNLAVGQLSTPESAAAARIRSLAEVDALLDELAALGIDPLTLQPVQEAVTAASVEDIGNEDAVVAFTMLNSNLFALQQQLGDDAEANDRNVKLLITAILVGTTIVLSVAGVSAAKRSRRMAADAAERATTQAQELRNRMLAQHASDLVTVVDADSTLQYASPSMTRMLGYEPLRREGLPLLEIVAEQDRETLLVAVADAVERNADSDRRMPLRMIKRSGELLDCEVVVVNLLHEPTIGGLVLTIYDVSERKAFEERLTTTAFYDTLTELPNRELLLDRTKLALQSTSRGAAPTSVVLVDLDQFSALDSSAGRAAVDAVLQDVAQRLVTTVAEHGTVARVGGDEFAILTSADETTIDGLVEEVLESLRKPSVVGDLELPCRASAGIATVSTPAEALELDSSTALLSRAGTAMRQAKNAGGDAAATYYDGMATVIEERLRLTADLRRALDRNNELFLEFQPSYDLRTGELKSAEALVRWQHPTEGRLAPDKFIAIAERNGLIVPLGAWVLRESCLQAASWPIPLRHLPASVSVNVAAAQLARPELVDEVAACLAESGLSAGRLILEITETTLLDDRDQVTERLQTIRDLGVRVAIDDFGTGYSSLRYLRELPVDILKIDKSFVDFVATADTDRELATTILAMAQNLNLATVAEGVEDIDQANVLRALGYETGQGYLWARPQDPIKLMPYLESGVWPASTAESTSPAEEPSRSPTKTNDPSPEVPVK